VQTVVHSHYYDAFITGLPDQPFRTSSATQAFDFGASTVFDGKLTVSETQRHWERLHCT
jgi:hypothetical protein